MTVGWSEDRGEHKVEVDYAILLWIERCVELLLDAGFAGKLFEEVADKVDRTLVFFVDENAPDGG